MVQEDLIKAADEAAMRGDIALARRHLESAIDGGHADLDTRLKQAALARATGDLPGAQAAVGHALIIDPLNFMALLLRASLLEQQGDRLAGEAYGWALAQKPAGELAPQLEAMCEHARRAHEAYCRLREDVMSQAAAPIEQTVDPYLAAKLARFRSNAVRRTRHWHSEPTDYHYPGLPEFEFWDRGIFPWLAELEAAYPDIRREFAQTVSAERGVPYVQYPETAPLRQWAELNQSRDWTALHLLNNGQRVEENARHCPATLAVLERLPQPRVANCSPNAMFSLLAPHTRIPAHVGVNNTRLVCHLPLIVPPGCWFRVGGETRPWEEGRAFVFDDTIEHEALNPSDELRVVLIFDVWHPGLSALEREALAAMLEPDVVREAKPQI